MPIVGKDAEQEALLFAGEKAKWNKYFGRLVAYFKAKLSLTI